MSINESQFRELLDRYLAGTATDEERKMLDTFFSSYATEASGKERFDEERKKSIILDRINEKVLPRKRSAFYMHTWFKVAATVSILVVAAFVVQRTSSLFGNRAEEIAHIEKTETSRKGERLTLTLPDGSRVFLNASSSISYASPFSEKREVKIEGEAYFEVAHDPVHPFTVTAGSASVQVLGTIFNINATRSSEVVVTLVDGKVKVNSSTQHIQLRPGYQAIVDNASNQISHGKVDVADLISWKDDVLVFNDKPLNEAVLILEQWYNTRIEIRSDALKTCRISGRYNNEPLKNVIKSIEFLLGAKADFSRQGIITLNGKGCKP